jgi:hypothetical protein
MANKPNIQLLVRFASSLEKFPPLALTTHQIRLWNSKDPVLLKS